MWTPPILHTDQRQSIRNYYYLLEIFRWKFRLKTEYPFYSCLHEMTFIKSPFECSNSNLVHQQNTIKQLFKLHSSKFTIFLFQHNFLRVKSWKSGVIRSFHMKFRKKSGIAQNQEKSGIIRKIRECLTDWVYNNSKGLWLY